MYCSTHIGTYSTDVTPIGSLGSLGSLPHSCTVTLNPRAIISAFSVGAVAELLIA
eukprot:COSAG01_NODE_13082_length_1637_cov_1.866797_2_plen_54_part_01